jgi:hypothetical protein
MSGIIPPSNVPPSGTPSSVPWYENRNLLLATVAVAVLLAVLVGVFVYSAGESKHYRNHMSGEPHAVAVMGSDRAGSFASAPAMGVAF